MAFFASAITTLQTLVIALGAGLGVWGVVNLLEGYGSDNPGSNCCGLFFAPILKKRSNSPAFINHPAWSHARPSPRIFVPAHSSAPR